MRLLCSSWFHTKASVLGLTREGGRPQRRHSLQKLQVLLRHSKPGLQGERITG